MKDAKELCTLEEIEAISFFSVSLRTKKSINEVLWDITKNVVHRLGFVDCVIYTYDATSECLLQQAAYGLKNPTAYSIYNRISIGLGEGIVGSVAALQKAEIVVDTSTDSRYIIDDALRLSEICVPILVSGELFGVIDSEHPQKGFYTQKHMHLLTIIASLCSQRIKELTNKKPISFDQDNHYFKKLKSLIQVQKIYRDPDFNLGMAAELLGISASYLSTIINSISDKSFIDFINECRIGDVKKNLHSASFAHYTVVSIGLEAGFNSKSAFYAAFKKYCGMTPTQYRELAQIGRVEFAMD